MKTTAFHPEPLMPSQKSTAFWQGGKLCEALWYFSAARVFLQPPNHRSGFTLCDPEDTFEGVRSIKRGDSHELKTRKSRICATGVWAPEYVLAMPDAPGPEPKDNLNCRSVLPSLRWSCRLALIAAWADVEPY